MKTHDQKSAREFWVDLNSRYNFISVNKYKCFDKPFSDNRDGILHVKEVLPPSSDVEEMSNKYAYGNDRDKHAVFKLSCEHKDGRYDGFKAGHASRQLEIDTLTAKVKRYEEALEFYADPYHYRTILETASCGCCSYEKDACIFEDDGKRARSALNKWDEK